MDNERLQEIKKRYEEEDGDCLYADIAVKDILALCTALEAAQAELVEEQKNGDSLVEQRNAWADVTANLRAQLAEAQAEVERLGKMCGVGKPYQGFSELRK